MVIVIIIPNIIIILIILVLCSLLWLYIYLLRCCYYNIYLHIVITFKLSKIGEPPRYPAGGTNFENFNSIAAAVNFNYIGFNYISAI